MQLTLCDVMLLQTTDPGAGANMAASVGIPTSRSRHNSRHRHSSASSTGALMPSTRTSINSRYCADPCATAVAESIGSTQQQAASDDYMQPVDEGTLTPKYDTVNIGKHMFILCPYLFTRYIRVLLCAVASSQYGCTGWRRKKWNISFSFVMS